MTLPDSPLDGVDPIAEFATWFARAAHAAEGSPFDPTEMSLATVSADGAPSVRVVLLKQVDARGFSFFTNYESRKGRELAASPRAALCWRWPWIDAQVRAEGEVERLPEAESDDYFASRPRGSRIGAWASEQSRPIASREALEAEVAAVEARYAGIDVPRPPHWGGFLLRPLAVEFWSARPSRLHDRRRFVLRGGVWLGERLAP